MKSQQLEDPDPFAEALEYYWVTGKQGLYYTRDDGYRKRENVAWYFGSYPEFWKIEKRALKFVRGRVLDLGCGAGRHTLYLQRKGFQVTAVDASPRVAALASERGVRDVRVASACARLPFRRGEFETVILFGNNLGICGNRKETARLLRELARVTKTDARVLATTRAPATFRKQHRDYWNDKLTRGQEFGVATLRLDFNGAHAKTIQWFWISPQALMELAFETDWRVAEIFGDGRAEEGYSAMLEKRK